MRERETQAETERGNRGIEISIPRAIPPGVSGAWSLASSTFDNFDNANYRMTN